MGRAKSITHIAVGGMVGGSPDGAEGGVRGQASLSAGVGVQKSAFTVKVNMTGGVGPGSQHTIASTTFGFLKLFSASSSGALHYGAPMRIGCAVEIGPAASLLPPFSWKGTVGGMLSASLLINWETGHEVEEWKRERMWGSFRSDGNSVGIVMRPELYVFGTKIFGGLFVGLNGSF